MGWSKGVLAWFGTFAARSHALYFNTLFGTDYSSFATSGGGVVSQASGGSGVGLRFTKTAAAGLGWRGRAASEITGLDTHHISLSHHIHLRSNAGASGIASGNTVVFFSWLPTAGGVLGEPGWKNVGANDGAGRDLRLVIVESFGVIRWQSSYTFLVDTDYQIQYRIYAPKPGVASTNWRHQIVLRSSTGTELDRSPIMEVNQGGTSVQDGAGTLTPAFGISGAGNTNTTDTPDYVVNTFAFVTRGGWSPDVVRGGTNGVATESATAGRNQWLAGPGGDKDDAVNPVTDLDDTTYIQTTQTSEALQFFTHAGANITLTGSEEIFAVRAAAYGRIVSGGGLLQVGLYNGTAAYSGTLSASSFTWMFNIPCVRAAVPPSYGSPSGGDAGTPWVNSGGGSADVNTVEYGVSRLLGAGSGQDKRVTGLVLEILYGLKASDAFGGNHTIREKNHTTTTRRPMPGERTP